MIVNFIGEYDCKVDAKGRILLTSGFRKQMGQALPFCFFIKKHTHEQCLELYTQKEWEHITQVINSSLDEEIQAQREFMQDAIMIESDTRGRVRIPSPLLKQVEITTDVILTGHHGKIEIWQPALYYE